MEASRRIEIKDTEITELRGLLKEKEEEISMIRRRMRAAEDEAITIRREKDGQYGRDLGLEDQIRRVREKHEEELKMLRDDLYYKQKVSFFYFKKSLCEEKFFQKKYVNIF